MAVVLVSETQTCIGGAVAVGLAGAGRYTVVAGSPPGSPRLDRPGLVDVELDLTSAESIAAVLDDIDEHYDGLDAVVANGRTGRFSPLELFDADELERTIEINLVGQLRLLHRAIGSLRRSDNPRIVGLSNTIGPLGLPGGSVSCAARGGLEVALDALRHELRPLGFRVSVVRGAPSDVADYGLPSPHRDHADYGSLVRSVNELGCQTMPAASIVELVDRALTDTPPRHRYHVGAYAELTEQLRTASDRELDEFVQDFFDIAP
ncbi:MAG: SDR family NAD(P)-dependent oxidoreductase [Actinomycetota bacterium]